LSALNLSSLEFLVSSTDLLSFGDLKGDFWALFSLEIF